MPTDWFATFKVRQAGLVTGTGVALLAASAILAIVTAFVIAAQPQGLLGRTDWIWPAALAFVSACAGSGCLIAGFIKLCTNVEYLAREAVDRRGGRG